MIKMLFEFKIVNKELFHINIKEVIKEDIKNKCNFYFDKDTYENKELFVTFVNKVGYSQTVFLGKWEKTLSCDIPPQILDYEYFKVFCYTKGLFKTSTLKVYNKIVLNDIESLIRKIDGKIDTIIYKDNQLKCYSDHILIDTVPLNDVDEAIVNELIDFRLSGFKEEINEQLEDYVSEEDLDYLIISL